MGKKYIPLVFILAALALVFFVTCENPIMEKWWDESETTSDPGRTISDEDTEVITVKFETDGGAPKPSDRQVPIGHKLERPAPMEYEADYTTTVKGFSGWYWDKERSLPWGFDIPVIEGNNETKDILTLYAGWADSLWTVSFVNDEGSTDPAPQKVAPGAQAIEVAAGTNANAGRGFAGWYSDAAWTIPWKFADPVTKNMTLYAKWVELNCTVFFNTNGGEPAPESQGLAYDTSLVAPAPPTRPDSTFGGWYTDPLFSGNPWDFSTKVTDTAMTLYAKWVTNQVTVQFNANGGEPAPASQNLIFGAKITEPPVMTQNEKDFVGWYTDAALTYAWNFNDRTVTRDITLYAKWNTAAYSVTFHVNGGKVKDGDTEEDMDPALQAQTVLSKSKVIKLPPLSKAGMGFGGWYIDPGFSGDPWNMNTEVEANLNLYAKWENDPYNVTFDANDGEPAPQPQKVAQNAQIVEPPALSKSGYSFGGWYTDTDELWNFASDESKVTGDMTLYAKWIENIYNYTITFNTNGGSPVPKPQTVVSGGKVTNPSEVMTKTGSVFAGWYKVGLEVPWDFNSTIKDTDVDNNIMPLYAKWNPAAYTVTFNVNGVNGENVNPKVDERLLKQDVYYNSKVIKLPPLTKTVNGNEMGLGGWYTTNPDPDAADYDSDAVIWDIDTPVTKDLNLYAKWLPGPRTVIFDENEGPPLSPALRTQKVALGAKIIEPPAISNTVAGFGGWYTNKDFSGTAWNFTTDTVTANLLTNNTMTLYAKWITNNYTVTFDATGGSPDPENQNVAFGEKVIDPSKIMTKEGNVFAGWYEDETFNYAWNFNNRTVTRDMTLYAKWNPAVYTVAFDVNGGNSLDPALQTQKVSHGSKVIKPSALTRLNMGFAGWYRTNPDSNPDAVFWDIDTPVTENLNLYAKWVNGPRTVTFYANGGIPEPAQQKVASGTKIVEPPALSKTGEGFGGWYTNSEGSGDPWNFTTGTVAGDTNLYAKWTTNNYTVTFSTNGGSPVPEVQRVVYSGKVIVPSVVMTKTGSVFAGWYKDDKFTVPWVFNDPVVNNMVLYAKWNPAVYIVTFNVNGDDVQLELDERLLKQNVSYNSKVIRLPVLGNSGWAFDGWWYMENPNDPINFTTAKRWELDTPVTKDLNLYAKWLLGPCTVTFDENEGPPLSPALRTQKVALGAKIIEPPAISNTVAGFGGWYTNKDGSGAAWNFVTDTVTEALVKNNTMTLYAKWTTNNYTVTFSTDGGSPVPEKQNVASDGKVIVPSVVMTKTGSVFAGWYKDEDLEYPWSFAADTVNSDTSLYAKWNPAVSTVTFDVKGGTVEGEPLDRALTTQRVSYNSKVIKLPPLTKPNMGFGGWYTTNPDSDPDAVLWNIDTPVVEDLNLYAKWENDPCTVIFYANGGTPEPAQQKVALGAKIVEPPVLTRPNMGFGGWYTSSGAPWDFATEVTEALVKNNTMTLYATWTTNNYTVTFDTNGGSPVPENQNVASGEKVIAPSVVMTKTGSVFAGWYKDKELVDPWSFAADTVNSSDTPLYAKWNPAVYTVKFDVKGGTDIDEKPLDRALTEQKVSYNSKVIKIPALTRPYMGFGGWYTTNPDSDPNAVSWDIDTPVTENLNLYAKWENDPYTVKFDAKDGNPKPADQKVASGTKIVEPLALSKTGYSFGGWYTASDFSGIPWDFAANTITISENSVTDNTMTLYARWIPPVYTVKFDMAGGTPSPEAEAPKDQSVVSGGKITNPSVVMTKTGSVFAGWYTDNNYMWDFSRRTVINTDVNGNIMTLYAKWDLAVYTVTFDVNGDDVTPQLDAALTTQRVSHGSKVIKPPALSKLNKAFNGWWYLDGTEKKWELDKPVEQDLKLYAKWEDVNYTVNFDAIGGTPAPQSQQVVSNATIIEPPVMSKTGYGFGGWYENQNLSGTAWDFFSTDKNKVTKNMTLYAKWVPNPYTVKFEPKGGSPAPGEQTVTYDSNVIPPSAMTQKGKSFRGWYLDETFTSTSEWNFDQKIHGDITLYARWETAEYIITFNTDTDFNNASSVPSQIVVYNSKIKIPANPTRSADDAGKSGYVFKGWYTSSDPADKTLYDFDTAVVEETPKTLYARWVYHNPLMAWIPGGTFTMGGLGGSGATTRLAHKVSVSGFYMFAAEITQGAFHSVHWWKTHGESLAGYNFEASTPRDPTDTNWAFNPSAAKGAYRPVESITWYDAVYFCNMVTEYENKMSRSGLPPFEPPYIITDIVHEDGSRGTGVSNSIANYTSNKSITSAAVTLNPKLDSSKTGYDPGKVGYRLPTEAEWEYAARGGNGSPGDYLWAGSNTANDVAWYGGGSGNTTQTQVWGQKAPNSFGIYDMSGNVCEWLWDYYDKDYYKTFLPGTAVDPVGPDGSPDGTRARRGGSIRHTADNCRTQVRDSDTPDNKNWNIGFRLARTGEE